MLSRHVFCFQHVCISAHLPIARGFLAINNCQNGQTFRTVISFKGKHWDQLLWINHVWRIIPVSKWLENPIYKPFKEGVPRPQVLGTTPITMIINHLAPRNLQLEGSSSSIWAGRFKMGYHMSTNKGGEMTPKLPIFKGMYYGKVYQVSTYFRPFLATG